MTSTVESWTQQGNSWFQAGDNNKAISCYCNALIQSGALIVVAKYVKKNKDNLFEDQELLYELLYTKYHVRLVHHALPLILLSTKKQIEELEEAKTYQRFKKQILSKHPNTPEQYTEIFLARYENPSWKDMEFLSKLLCEQGFNYYICDVDRLCHEHQRTRELKWFEHSLDEKKTTKLSDIDKMTGHQFEEFLMTLLTKQEYKVTPQKRSHEHGLDLLLERQFIKTACQIKRHKKPIGNHAVMEVIAARDYYNCQQALVITNNHFTPAAKQLAERCSVELWDRKTLKEKIKKKNIQ